jgi:hypothetical protein
VNWTQRTTDYSWHATGDDGTRYVVSRTYNKDGTAQWCCAWVMPEREMWIATAAWETAGEAKNYMENIA